MDGGDYQSDMAATPARLAAAVLVAVWLAVAYTQFGLGLAVRATVLFSIALAMIWLPAVLARLRPSASDRDSGYAGPIAPAVMRWVGWTILLGLPAVWFLFSKIFGR